MTSSILALWSGFALAFAGPVTEVAIRPAATTTEVVIEVQGTVEYRDFTMQGPNRLVLDLFGARHQLGSDEYAGLNRGGVRMVRASQYSDDVVRVVLELDELVPYELFAEPGRLRVVLENRSGAFDPWSSGAAAPARTPAARPSASRATSAPETNQRRQPLMRANTRVEPRQEARPVTVEFVNAPIRDVLFFFSEFSGRSIVAGQDVQGLIDAKVRDQPWDQALDVILQTNGFVAEELENGIIRVDNVESLNQREEAEPIFTRAYRINYATAQDVVPAIQEINTERGGVSAAASTNSVVVTDIARVHKDVEQLIQQLDVRTPSVNIQAKIVFVNRTDLDEFGVIYDLKDSQGNQLNQVSPGAADQDGDGVIELPDEVVQQGQNVVSLGGNSVAALGNASARVPNPTLTLLSSLIVGRHTLVTFIEALRSLNLSDIQAEPSVTVRDNVTARIQVGERTPLRVIDAQGAGGVGGAAGGAAGGAQGGAIIPQATVEIEETGIILEATPHVTGDNHILLELRAERSAPQLAQSDVGFIFTTQNANSEVLVRDGETVVIGGLTVTEANEVRSGIPFLMDLPLIGGLFRTTRSETIQRDLIIMVTPTIVRDQAN